MKNYYKTIKQIEKECGRIEKSHFVIMDWILKSERHIYNLKKQGVNRKDIGRLYSHKDRAVKTLLKAGMLDVKISKPKERAFTWLYVLGFERKGIKMEIVVPYLTFKKQVGKNAKELEEVTTNRDTLYMDGRDITLEVIKEQKFKLKFILENLEKSRRKLIDKMEGK